MPVPLGDLVAATLRSENAADTCAALVGQLRVTFEADRVTLVRLDGKRAVIVHTEPEDRAPAPPDERLLVAAAEATLVVQQPAREVLALGFRPPGDRPSIVVLERAAGWSPREAEALADVGPQLGLVVAHAALQRRLTEAHGREAAADATRQRFLAVLSHELRNPLAPILMWTSTLKRLRLDDPEVQRATQAIEHAVSLARRLIEDLIDMSRLERGMIELRREPLDLRTVVNDVVGAQESALTAGELTLERDLPEQPVPVEGDRQRLAQIVGNLVGNAVKFTPRGGRVSLRLAVRDRHAELEISDTGPGMPPEVAPYLFEPFRRGPNARGGLGVGLAVARWLVALHGGTIEPLESRAGAGFRIAFPLAA
jgi:signal transduction histidine kinase